LSKIHGEFRGFCQKYKIYRLLPFFKQVNHACENAIARGVKRVQNSYFDGYDRSLYNAMLFDVLEHI